MNERLEQIRKQLEECSPEEVMTIRLHLQKLFPHPLERAWGIDSDTILDAIIRSSDLTKRGVRGIIAEAIFVNEVLPKVKKSGWEGQDTIGDHPFDALLVNGDRKVRIQVKLQRLEKGVPKLFHAVRHLDEIFFVVEVQKTRSGTKRGKKIVIGAGISPKIEDSANVQTRPYCFGDFDILAVNLHPSSGDWRKFRFTLASWLLPRASNPNLIEIFQPVAVHSNEVWTDSLAQCLEWFEVQKQGCVLPATKQNQLSED